MYTVLIKRSAQKEIASIAEPYRSAIIAAIAALATTPRPTGCKKLKGHQRSYRIRIGDYRVIYEVEDKTVTVTVEKAGHRSKIYED